MPQCPSVDPIDYTIQYPAESCTEFYKCENGVPVLYECPNALFYNAQLEVCDYPERSGCVQAWFKFANNFLPKMNRYY